MAIASNLNIFLYSILLAWVHFTHHARSEEVERSSYIVHMDTSIMPNAFISRDEWYSSIIHSLSQKSVTSSEKSQSSPQLIYSYDSVIQGFSARLSIEERKKLETLSGVVSSYVDREIKYRTTHTPKFLSLNPSSGIWPASQYGKDVIVGVVDTGVWPESLSFGDDGMTKIPAKWKGACEEGEAFNVSMCNLKLIGARYFNKGLIASKYPGFKPKMNSARDINGHGTHTASTAVGNYVDDVSYFGYAKGTASGVAPRARLAVYKVIWEEGSWSSDFLAAIDQAVADGVDVISLSLGYSGDIAFYENPIAISCFAAMEKGIIVSHSAGNSGPSLGSIYDAMPWSLTVGAGSIDRLLAATVTLGNGLTITGSSTFPVGVLVETVRLAYNKTFSSCNSSLSFRQAPHGSIIICKDIGNIATQLYYFTYYGSSLVAAIYISDDQASSYSVDRMARPGVVISPLDAEVLISYAKMNGSTASVKFQQTILGTKPAPYVADYSSRGPSRSYNGILAPDLIAPGSLVLAAWVPTVSAARIGSDILKLASDYHIISGTSMSCPHISGVAALLKSIHPMWTPAMIRSAMMTTANPLDNTGHEILDQGMNFTSASPLVMGSGHVVPNLALDPGLVYDTTPQDYVNVLCYMNYTKNQIYTVTRSRRYNCSNPSPDLNYPSFISVYAMSSSEKIVQTFNRVLTNVGNGTTYRAEVIAPIGSKITIVPKMLVFDKLYHQKSFTMTIEYRTPMEKIVTYGSLTWVELGIGSKYTVRSPIVISPEVKASI